MTISEPREFLRKYQFVKERPMTAHEEKVLACFAALVRGSCPGNWEFTIVDVTFDDTDVELGTRTYIQMSERKSGYKNLYPCIDDRISSFYTYIQLLQYAYKVGY